MDKKLVKFSILTLSSLLLFSCSEDNNPVAPPENPHSPYISKVYEFMPAVGQFTNALPAYTPEDTPESMLKKVEKALVGAKTSMISLGGFGGYVVFGFDHTVENRPGLMDFRIKGNAFKASYNPNEQGNEGGSSEPGIVMVSYDENKNGLPDDPWYEIAGSHYDVAVKNYEITYYRPTLEKDPVAGPNDWQVDTQYIKWTDNQGNSGFKTQNKFHEQSYFPLWISADQITFKGTKLPDNAVNEGTETDPYWVLYSYDWGYADNASNQEDRSAIDIDWAIDQNGNPVHLNGIDFIKVYSAINQEAGWLGEVSTEITGAEDLHALNKQIPTQVK